MEHVSVKASNSVAYKAILLITALVAALCSSRRRRITSLPIHKLLCFALGVRQTEIDFELVYILENGIPKFCTPELYCHRTT